LERPHACYDDEEIVKIAIATRWEDEDAEFDSDAEVSRGEEECADEECPFCAADVTGVRYRFEGVTTRYAARNGQICVVLRQLTDDDDDPQGREGQRRFAVRFETDGVEIDAWVSELHIIDEEGEGGTSR
jgi:hypothetical protein